MKSVKYVLGLLTVVGMFMLAEVATSCRNSAGGKMVADTVSAEIHDSAYWYRYTHKLGDKASEYYNNGQTDSLEVLVPEAMKICREHNQISMYYIIWSFLADEYIYDDEFDKAVAEAKRMQDTAISRHEDYGLFISYSTLGKGYGYRENLEESVKYDELDSLRACRFSSSRQVIEDLKTQVEAHRNGATPNDDLTMMCIRYEEV